jgi:uncharacterized phage protein gp47/JayE
VFENKTVDSIQADLLENISDNYEKTIGYPVYDLCKSFSIEEANIYKVLEALFNKVDVDNLVGDDLTKYVKQRKGVIRKLANASTTNLTVIGNGTITIGNLFETPSGVQFKATETKVISGTGTVAIESVVAGTIGNVPANTITQMPITITGITSVTNSSAITNGYDAETDNALRERYYDILQNPVTSGNKYFYVKSAKEVTGVGDALCYPLFNGDNTVKVVIVDNNKEPATLDLVSTVQNYIDPLDTNGLPTGTGDGVAPIGAHCTVESATGKEITIKVKVTKSSENYIDDEIISNIKANIKSYFSDIGFDKNNAYVSYAKIGNLVITSEGVSDYSNLTINDGTSNIDLVLSTSLNEVPIIKDVILL